VNPAIISPRDSGGTENVAVHTVWPGGSPKEKKKEEKEIKKKMNKKRGLKRAPGQTLAGVLPLVTRIKC
jgi:hypothetical protein